MSSSTETLKQGQIEAIKEWIEKKATKESAKCPICGHQQWAIGEHLIRTSIHTPGVTALGGQAYVYAHISCTNCAYTRFFNAVMLGLVPPAKEVQDGQK